MIFGAQRPPLNPHALARQIVAERRFRMHIQAAAHKTWWDVLVSWLGDRWNQLVDAFAHHVHLGARTSIAAGDLILVLAAAVVLVVLIRLVASYVRETPAAAGVPIVPRHVAAEALYARSLQAADTGDFAAAITLLFRAALVALDVRGVLRDEPSLTVNECRREVRDRAPRFLNPFDALARIFTSALYAETAVNADQWAAAHQAYAQLARGDSYEA